MSEKVEHLKMIQTIISRMAGNSFFVKGWCVTLVTAILALAAREPNKFFVAIAFFPALMFWILDGYFLYQERLFRKLYDTIISRDEASIDYSMNISAFRETVTWRGAIFSQTLNLFYIFILSLILAIFLILCFYGSAAKT